MEERLRGISRKDFLKLSAVAAASFAISGAETSCSTLPVSKLPAMDRRKGLFLRNCTVVDVERGAIEKGKSITVVDGAIRAIADATAPPSAAFEIVDAGGAHVVPGLIDAHCHTTLPCMNGWYPSLLNDMMIQLERNYTQQIRAGVTTVRDCGAAPKLLAKYAARVAGGSLPGPRVVSCVMFMNIANSHPDIDPRDLSSLAGLVLAITGSPQANFTDTADLKRKLGENLAHGPAFLKLTLDQESLMCGKGDLNVYSDEHFGVIREFAAAHDLPITGHCHRKFGFDRALKHGINLEHSIGDAFITDDEAAEMARKKISIVPTLTVGQLLAHEEVYTEVPAMYRGDYIDGELRQRREFLYHFDERYCQPAIHRANMDLLRNYRKYPCDELYRRGKLLTKSWVYFGVLKHARENIQKMKRAGVLIGCGTDAGIGFLYHGAVAREIEMLGRTGLTPLEALRCATINNAKILRMDDRIGTLSPGKFADMVVLEKNPLADITACREPRAVFKGGALMHARGPAARREGIVVL